MTYVHEDRDAFGELIERVADRLDRDRFMIEKDYWVTHALHALTKAGFTVWFKGETSLSKGFSLIERFSEDLDIKLEHPDVPEPTSWSSTGSKAHKKSRETFFDALLAQLVLPPFVASKEPISDDDGTARNLNVRLDWPEHLHAQAGAVTKEYVLLEIGSTRVTPHVDCDITSWVHDELAIVGSLAEFDDNRARVRCLHPLVTLIEKLTILEKRAPDVTYPPDRFIRHYEDAARIARAHVAGTLPTHADCADPRTLVDVMKRIKRDELTAPRVAAFHLDALPAIRRSDLERAHDAIGGLFFGARQTLEQCAAQIREWTDRTIR